MDTTAAITGVTAPATDSSVEQHESLAAE